MCGSEWKQAVCDGWQDSVRGGASAVLQDTVYIFLFSLLYFSILTILGSSGQFPFRPLPRRYISFSTFNRPKVHLSLFLSEEGVFQGIVVEVYIGLALVAYAGWTVLSLSFYSARPDYTGPRRVEKQAASD